MGQGVRYDEFTYKVEFKEGKAHGQGTESWAAGLNYYEGEFKDGLPAKGTFIYEGEHFELIGLSGGDLITPEQFGMESTMIHTACYKGFYATYEIKEKNLMLQSMTI